MINSAIYSASAGIQNNYARFADAVNRISDPDFAADVRDIMDLKKAEHGVKVNVAVLKRANALADGLIDILA